MCTRVAGDGAQASPTANGERIEFWDYPSNQDNSAVLRCDVPVASFTKIRGMYTIDTTDPITGAGQDPDNNFAITMLREPNRAPHVQLARPTRTVTLPRLACMLDLPRWYLFT